MFYGICDIAPYNVTYAWCPMVVGFIFNYWIKRRWQAWWEKYAYVFTTAMSCGVAISAIIIFFAVEYKEVDLNWWGNEVSYAGCDNDGCALLAIPEGGKI